MIGEPLAGVRVVDLTSVVFGPLATQTLGDMGADVIKVEAPEGDLVRAIGPARSPGMGALYLNVNRNKRSLALDLKRPEGRAALLRVIEGADVFVHSIRPGALARLGLDWPSLRPLAPRLIHVSLTGFGTGGPYADRPAFDDVIQAGSGLADVIGRLGGPEGPPRYAPTIMADKTAALAAVGAVAAALFGRERTGEGGEVEVPMLESLAAFVLAEHLGGAVFDPPEGPMGYSRVLSPHRRPFAAADGHLNVMPYTTAQWRRFFTALGRPDLAEDPRVNDPALRAREIGWLYGIIGELTPSRTVAEWLDLLRAADVPAIPVNRLEDLFHDPHLAAVGFFLPVEHPSEGRLTATAPPLRFDGAAGPIRRHAPRLGEHSAEVLAEAGLSGAEIDALAASGACIRA